ncbi:MAG TPA: hypothetical protein VJO34_01775 [Methylomirabilota bacterium]|nr:hypothetical protein [Methylomirabilota bacterium]
MKKTRTFSVWMGVLMTSVLLVSCASSPPRPVRSEFDDIPIPRGLTFKLNDSDLIESPTVKAGRLVYTGWVEGASLAQAFRSSLEAQGWRFVSTTLTAGKGIVQTFEKGGNSLQVFIDDRWWWTTRVELTVTKHTTPAVNASPIPDAK